MIACNNNQCPIKKDCQRHKKNSPESVVFTKHVFTYYAGQTGCDEFVFKSKTPSLKLDGNPKKSGGDRPNAGRKKAEKGITKEQAISALENLGYSIPNLEDFLTERN